MCLHTELGQWLQLFTLQGLQGSLTHKKGPLPDNSGGLGMVLLKGPRGELFLMREVPLYSNIWSTTP